jgi:hypothetical protein
LPQRQSADADAATGNIRDITAMIEFLRSDGPDDA